MTNEHRKHHTLQPAIQRFSDSLAALREFVEVIRPVLESRSSEELRRSARDLAPALLALEALESFEGVHLRLSPEQREQIKQEFTGHIDVEVEETSEGGKKASVSVRGSSGQKLMDAFQRLSKTVYQSKLLYETSLISLVSAAEWFLSQILHFHFDNHPEALGDRKLTLRQLQAMDSMEEAERYLVDLRVEELLRGSFDEWISFLRDQLKLSMKYLAEDQEQLVEIYQRRNLLVHNGGYINRIYRDKVQTDFHAKLRTDEPLSVSDEYLENAIAIFERNFVLIAAELWKKQLSSDEQRGNLLNTMALNHLVAERWRIAESLSHFVMNDKKLPELCQLVAQVNYWQSLKWQERFEEVRLEVEQADFSAKSEIFRLAQLALMDDEKAFFELLPRLLEIREVTEDDLRSWPLFRVMRETATYKGQYGNKLETET